MKQSSAAEGCTTPEHEHSLDEECDILDIHVESDVSAQITWNQIEKKKFFMVSTPVLSLARGAFYPLGVIKTRLMVQKNEVYSSTFRAMMQISKKEGVRGLYAGFSTNLVGILPGQLIYVTAYESLRQHLSISNDTIRSFAAGFLASCMSSVVSVPVDIIIQRQMIQTKAFGETSRQYRHGIDGFKTILKEDGIRGLYRGMGSSISVYAPTSALYWSFYNFYKSTILPEESNAALVGSATPLYYMTISACSAILTSCTVGLITNPLDVVKTTLQTQEGKNVPRNMFQMAIHLHQRDGLLKFWTRGLVARTMAISLNSTVTLLLYEAMKVYALKEEYKDQQDAADEI